MLSVFRIRQLNLPKPGFTRHLSSSMSKYISGSVFHRNDFHDKKLHIQHDINTNSNSSEKEPFFNPNKTGSIPQPSTLIKRYLETQLQFEGLKLFPQQLSLKSTEIEDLIRQKTYDSIDLQELIDCNENHVPIVGSIISFKDHDTNQLSFGLVIREALSKFNESYNKTQVLTIDNRIESIYTQDIDFHFHGVIEHNWINSLQILANRHDESYYSRTVLVNLIKYFMNKALEVCDKLTLDIAYAQNSHETRLVHISLLHFFDSFPEQSPSMSQDYFHQSVMILAIYNKLNQAPHQWLLSSNYQALRGTNIVDQSCSNNLIQRPHIFAIPHELSNSLNTITNTVKSDTKSLAELNSFIEDFTRQQKSVHKRDLIDLHMLFNLWDGRKFKYFLDALKYLLVYPNPDVMRHLNKLSCFQHLEVVRPSDVFEFLKSMGIYNDLSDIHLSMAGICTPKHAQKIAIEAGENLSSKLDSRQTSHDTDNRDLFHHIRRPSPLGIHDLIYGLPIGMGEFCVGVSLQKLNTRNYIFSIHIPDLMTKIAPKSNTFTELVKQGANSMKVWNNSVGVFDREFVKNMGFSDRGADYSEGNEMKNVREIMDSTNKKQARHRDHSDTCHSCMTISFKFNTHDSNPFDKIADKVSITFDDISKTSVKTLNSHELKSAINGKRNTLPFSLFRSQGQNQESESKKLIDEDYQQIGFLYGILKSHFSVRNINGSMNAALEGNIDNDPSLFFMTELDHLASTLAGQYCKHHEIPMYSRSQDLLSMTENYDPTIDEVLVNHNNLLLPHFHSNSFFQTLISRDARGYVSLPAYIIGKNYLARAELGTQIKKHIPKGMDTGYVSIINPLDYIEAILNQYQLLVHTHWSYVTEQKWRLYNDKDATGKEQNLEYSLAKRFSYLKGLGYNLNGPLSKEILENHIPSITNSEQLNEFIAKNQIRYWKLKQLETMENRFEFECVITRTGQPIPQERVQLCKCYVKQLNLEVDVAVETPADISIGSVIKSDKVVYLNALDHICVLGEMIPY